MSGLQFKEIWAVDFEYIEPDGEIPTPVCLVSWELHSRRRIQLWQDEFGSSPPYSIATDCLFVSFAADAELKCHLALGWSMPARVLDLRIEFLQAINITPREKEEVEKDENGKKKKRSRSSLLRALTYYGLEGIAATEKSQWRDTIMRGPPWTQEEREGILDYCETDVDAIDRLLPVMIRRGHIHFDSRLALSLYRGRYMRAVAKMEFTGVPIDAARLDLLREHWGPMKERLIEILDKDYGVYHEGSFSEKRFARYLVRQGWGWPVLDSGRMDLKEKTFRKMAEIHPELELLRQLRYSLDGLKLNDLRVGHDGFNRVWLNPFGSRTSRNQPSNTEFIFGPAVWLRDFLIQPPLGWGLAYLDWASQEFGIAAALSGDPNMLKAYQSRDIYITFGQQAHVLPEDATEETHPIQRDQFKVCVLATQYGQKYQALAERLNQPDIAARQLLAHHHKVYKVFWNWSDNRVNHALFYNIQRTVFGWTHRFKEWPKINSVRNFDMQSNGAEMLRLACCLGTENEIKIVAPVHDAVLIAAPIDRLQDDVARMQAYMEEASRVVLAGFRLRTGKPHVFVYPERYNDPKSRGKQMLEVVMNLLPPSNE